VRYDYGTKSSGWDTFQMILYILFTIICLGVGIWYEYIDISAKLAVREMAKQQQNTQQQNGLGD
jgi:hypothetical protein